MPKNAQTTAQLHSSHTLVKQCSKFSKAGFSNTWTMNFQMFKLVLEKAEEWLIHVNVWQKPLQYCKVISLQLIKINDK